MKKSAIDKPISITCVTIIVAFVILSILKPDATLAAVNVIFDYATAIFGVPILWFVFIGLFVCLYLATSLDSASFAIAVAGSKSLDEKGNPNLVFRLLMCVVLVLIPMAFLFTGAPFSSIKTLCIVLSIPFLFVIVGMLVGLFKWLKDDSAK